MQERILTALNVKLCAAVSPRELFRIGQISLYHIRHPDDLAGFDNLNTLTYSGALNHVHFADTPELTYLQLQDMPEWPAGWSFSDLPKLGRLELRAEGAAACQLFNPQTLDQLFAPLEGRINDVVLSFGIKIPPSITDDGRLAAVALGDALGIDLEAIVDREGARNIGRERWESLTAEERAETMESWGWGDTAVLYQAMFRIEISESYGCSQN